MKVYVVLGQTMGDSSWIESVFTDKEHAQLLATELNADDAGWNAYSVEESTLRTRPRGELLRSEECMDIWCAEHNYGDQSGDHGYWAEGA